MSINSEVLGYLKKLDIAVRCLANSCAVRLIEGSSLNLSHSLSELTKIDCITLLCYA